MTRTPGVARSARCTRAGTSQRDVPTSDLSDQRPFRIIPRMKIPRRKSLPHEIPSWVDPQKEINFISVNCEERFKNQLALPDVSQRLFETRPSW
jgi:hypothetical protein